MKKEELNVDNLVKLNLRELNQLSQGRFIYANHPTYGLCKAIPKETYVLVRELTEEERKEIKER